MRCMLMRWRMKKTPALLAIGMTVVPCSVAQASAVAPYVKTQTGGYAGFATLGLGAALFGEIWRAEALYGYVPAALAGSSQNILAFKTDVATPSFALPAWASDGTARWTLAFVGGGLIYNLSRRVFATLPEDYPEEYYASTALHWEAHLGTEVSFGQAQGSGGSPRHSVYAETNMHELSWLAAFDNPRYFSAANLLTYTLGYKLKL